MLIATDKPDTPERKPIVPNADMWREAIAMLCEPCRHFPGCDVVEGMIEMKEGGEWPEGGWVTDPGAGMTCLSYQPMSVRTLSDDELMGALSDSVSMCDGCAARKGTDASKVLHTQRDFSQAVKDRGKFMCHKPESKGKSCGGWCSAVLRRRGDA